jgi:hypothetical protein
MGKLPSFWRRFIRNAVAILIWTLIALPFFGLDVGRWVSEWAATSPWLGRYTPLIVACSLVPLALVARTWDFWKVVAHVVFFPLIVLYWALVLIISQVVYAARIVLIMYRVVASRPARIVAQFAVLWSIWMVLARFPPAELRIAMAILFGFLIGRIVKPFLAAFSGADGKTKPIADLPKLWKLKDESSESAASGGDAASSEDVRVTSKISTDVFRYALCTFALRRLQRVHESSLTVLWVLAQFAVTFATTVFVFALEFYALHTLDPGAFSNSEPKGFLFFLYFSFSTSLGDDIYNFAASSAVARSFVAAERLCSLVIGVALFFIVTTIVRDRYQRDVEWLVGHTRDETNALRARIEARHRASMPVLIRRVEDQFGGQDKLLKALLGDEYQDVTANCGDEREAQPISAHLPESRNGEVTAALLVTPGQKSSSTHQSEHPADPAADAAA